MPKETLNVSVRTFEGEFDLKLKANATGKILFDTIATTTGVRETWYFSLHYSDILNQPAWLINEKKIIKQKVKRDNPLRFQFKFKFFPENVTEEVIQDITLRFLFKQVKNDILTGTIYCPPEKAVLLASFAAQAKFGDFGTDGVERGYLANEQSVLPPKILSGHKLSMLEWEEKICEFHKKHKLMTREEAMMEYLKLAQDLEMFGVSYYPVTNAKGTEVLLGVDALGINFYEVNNKLTPTITFPWSEIDKVTFKKEKFIIKFTEKGKTQKVKCKLPGSARQIYHLAKGNNDMHARRRLPDELVVQQMKAQREQERAAREKQRATLRKELLAREKAEQEQKNLEKKLKELEEEAEARRKELQKAKERIEALEKQLAETQAAREALELQQEELRDLYEKLEHDRTLEAEERQRLEEEVETRRQEIEEFRAQVEAKEDEARKLQEEMEEAKITIENASLAMQANSAASEALLTNGDAGSESDRTSSSSSESAGEHEGIVEGIPSIIVQKVDDEDREPDQRTQALLKELRSELSGTQTQETLEDRQYRENLAQGRDKFKTLREVRKGNTKRRIDTFENM